MIEAKDTTLVEKLVKARKDGRQEGRQEVVEWIEKNHLLYDPDYDDRERWQAQKKVWGIK